MANERIIRAEEATQVLVTTANFSQGLLPLQFRMIKGIALYEPGWRMSSADYSEVYENTRMKAAEIVFKAKRFPKDPPSKHHPLRQGDIAITQAHIDANIQLQLQVMRITLNREYNPTTLKYLDENRVAGIVFADREETLEAIGEGMLMREQYFFGRRGDRTFFEPYIMEGKQTGLPVMDRIFADVKTRLYPNAQDSAEK